MSEKETCQYETSLRCGYGEAAHPRSMGDNIFTHEFTPVPPEDSRAALRASLAAVTAERDAWRETAQLATAELTERLAEMAEACDRVLRRHPYDPAEEDGHAREQILAAREARITELTEGLRKAEEALNTVGRGAVDCPSACYPCEQTEGIGRAGAEAIAALLARSDRGGR